MKTYKNLFDKVCSYETLYNSYLKARRGKTELAEVLKFSYNLEDELSKLQDELKTKLLKQENTGICIFEPKEEKFLPCLFRDRVVHHAIQFCN